MLKSNTKCFVNQHGQIVSLIEVYSSDNNYVDGTVDSDGITIQSWDESLNVSSAHDATQNYYWDGSSWQPRTPFPSPYHVWQNAAWIFDSDRFFDKIRRLRNEKLTESDWTQLPDSPLSTDVKNTWAVYRQGLRDITDNLDGIESLDDVIWPTKPE